MNEMEIQELALSGPLERALALRDPVKTPFEQLAEIFKQLGMRIEVLDEEVLTAFMPSKTIRNVYLPDFILDLAYCDPDKVMHFAGNGVNGRLSDSISGNLAAIRIQLTCGKPFFNYLVKEPGMDVVRAVLLAIQALVRQNGLRLPGGWALDGGGEASNRLQELGSKQLRRVWVE